MTGPQRAGLWAATLLVAGSGGGYGFALYFVENDDPFVAYNHPWQPYLQSAHLLVAPLLVFSVGWVFQDHALARLRGKKRKKSGLALLFLFALSVLSGYGLLVGEFGELVHEVLVWTHGLGASLWVLLFLFHAITGARLARAPRRPQDRTSQASVAATSLTEAR